MKIRKASSQDYKKISLIFKEEYSKTPYNEKWTEKSAEEKIKEYSHKSFMLVAEESEEIIGFIIFSEFLWDEGPKIFIDEIVITEKFQRQGIGKKLINKVEEYSIKSSKKGISLLAHKEAEAKKFYQKLGFKESKLILFDKTL